MSSVAALCPYDLAAIVDPEGTGRTDGAGDIDRGKAAGAVEEAIGRPVGGKLLVIPRDLAAIVDPVGNGTGAPGTAIVVNK